jgi:hypothetical protein
MTIYQFHTWMTSTKSDPSTGLSVVDQILLERDGDYLFVTQTAGKADSNEGASTRQTRIASFQSYGRQPGEEIFVFNDTNPKGVTPLGRFEAAQGEITLRLSAKGMHLTVADRRYQTVDTAARDSRRSPTVEEDNHFQYEPSSALRA